MKKSLQLKIPTPCSEDWGRMQPTDKGRHCQSCCKTVVDFTDMSDAEIIRHLSQSGPHICGRLMPDQLNRTLKPSPVQKNGRSGWAWVLASLLMLAEGSDKGRSANTGKMEVREPRTDTDSFFPRIIGVPVPRIRKERLATRIVADTSVTEMGDVAVVNADSTASPADTLPAVEVVAMPVKKLTGYAGGIQVCVKAISLTAVLADTVKGIVSDTLAALGWRPAPDLNIYPNPVSRGGAIQLAWKTEPGQYQLTLISMRGQLIAERILDVSGAGQVDNWEMPASLATGIYVLRVVRQGNPGAEGGTGAAAPVAVCTREIMVR